MAIVYLSSVDGSDSDNGSTWALAKATLAAALTAAGAGGTVYVDPAHAEAPGAGITLTSPGTAASPTRVICVSRAGNPEPPTAVSTGATVSSGTGADPAFAGFAYSYGVSYAGRNLQFNSTVPWAWTIEAATLSLLTSTGTLIVGSTSSPDDQLLKLVNTKLSFAFTNNSVVLNTLFEWYDTATALQGAAVPATLFTAGVFHARGVVRGVDLSAAGSGKNLVSMASVTGAGLAYRFENCKLGASVTLTTGTNPGQGGTVARFVNCDSADTNTRYHKQDYQGTISQETTIVRTGGANDGTTVFSRKMVSTANAKFEFPLESDPVVFWNETTGVAITVTVETVTDNVTLTDAEAWVECEYLGTSGFPLSATASDRITNILTTPANQTTSSDTWTTTGLTTPVKQKFSVTFTPQEKGPVKCRVMLAKASTTLYFDPKATVT